MESRRNTNSLHGSLSVHVDNMKRILIFSLTYYPRFIGGAEVAIKEITNRLGDEYEFHMITLRLDDALPKKERMGNVIVHRIGPAKRNISLTALQSFPWKLTKYWYQFVAPYYAIKLHKQYDFSCVWAMMAHSCGIPAGLFKKKYPEVPYLLTLQEGDPPTYIEKMMRPVWPLFTRGFTSADALQSISTFLQDWGRSMGFNRKAEVIPNGVDVVHFNQPITRHERDIYRASLGIKESDILLITASRLVHKNAVDDVIRSLVLLPAHIHFLVCGTGPDEVMLCNLASELGVEDRVHFKGHISHEVLPTALHSSDIFIRPSRSEGMGNAFIEAMVAGLPVIATQEGGISDFLFDAIRNPEKGATGWAVDANAPEQIASVTKHIESHPEEVAKTVERARCMVASQYTWNSVVARMRILLRTLV